MTLQQEAHLLIDTMPDDELRALILLMGRRGSSVVQQRHEAEAEAEAAEKRAAFEELLRMRDKISASFPPDFDPEQDLITALEKKYGSVG